MTKQDLSSELMRAARYKDIDGARRVFDKVLWGEGEVTPDPFRLLVALMNGDQPMARLLVTHGGGWDPADARHFKDIFSEQWPQFENTLRKCGVTGLSGLPDIEGTLRKCGFKNLDALMRPSMQRREDILKRLIEDKDFETPELRAIANIGLTAAATEHLRRADGERARKLLRIRQPEGPLDVDDVIDRLVRQEGYSTGVRKALATLVGIGGFHMRDIKPVELDMALAVSTPEIIPILTQRRLMQSPPPNRFDYLKELLGSDEPPTREHIMAAKVLFPEKQPMGNMEVFLFLSNCSSARADGGSIERACRVLHDAGLLDSKCWDARRKEQLAELFPDASGLSRIFTKQAAWERFAGMEKKALLENFGALSEAHRHGHYASTEPQTEKLLQALADRYRNGVIPARDEVGLGLHNMKTGGAEFRTPRQMAPYLGRKDPGLAKIMFDLGIAGAKAFDLHDLARRAKLQVDSTRTAVIVDERDAMEPISEYQVFFYRVALAQKFPKQFGPGVKVLSPITESKERFPGQQLRSQPYKRKIAVF